MCIKSRKQVYVPRYRAGVQWSPHRGVAGPVEEEALAGVVFVAARGQEIRNWDRDALRLRHREHDAERYPPRACDALEHRRDAAQEPRHVLERRGLGLLVGVVGFVDPGRRHAAPRPRQAPARDDARDLCGNQPVS